MFPIKKKWYIFRASYGREDKAFDFLVEYGTFVYIGKRFAGKKVNGKCKRVLEKLIPNILFAYTTSDNQKNMSKTPLRLLISPNYYNHFELDDKQKNPPTAFLQTIEI